MNYSRINRKYNTFFIVVLCLACFFMCKRIVYSQSVVKGKHTLNYCYNACGEKYNTNTIWGYLNIEWCEESFECAECLDACNTALEEYKRSFKKSKIIDSEIKEIK